jgi:hypothetical protein
MPSLFLQKVKVNHTKLQKLRDISFWLQWIQAWIQADVTMTTPQFLWRDYQNLNIFFVLTQVKCKEESTQRRNLMDLVFLL